MYLHDLSRDKVPDVTHRNISLLGGLLEGQLPISSVILVTTKWGNQKVAVCEAREKELLEVYWKELLEPLKGRGQARAMKLASNSIESEEWVVSEIVHPILRRFDRFVGEAALESLRKMQKSLHGLRVKSEEFRRALDAALDKSVLLHVRTLALEEGVATREDIEVWAEELEKSNQDVHRLFSQFSAWDRVRLSLTRRRYFR